MTSFAAWLGLTQAPGQEDGIPSWHGVATRTKLLCGAAWLLVAFALFLLLRWLMPAEDGLSGAAPFLIAVLVNALGMSWTERGLISAAPRASSGTAA